MSQVASAALVQALDGSGLYTEQRNLALWQRVPPELRLTEFSPSTTPGSSGVSLAAGVPAGVARL